MPALKARLILPASPAARGAAKLIARRRPAFRRTVPHRSLPLQMAGPRARAAVSGALRRMIRGYAQPLSVPELAREAGLSTAYFAAVFREETGLAPHDWLIARRIEKAKALLGRGESPAAVAAATGFADQAHLTRTFRARTGETPGAFARKVKARERPEKPAS